MRASEWQHQGLGENEHSGRVLERLTASCAASQAQAQPGATLDMTMKRILVVHHQTAWKQMHIISVASEDLILDTYLENLGQFSDMSPFLAGKPEKLKLRFLLGVGFLPYHV